jgi:uncharacterized protein (TIGR04222 family)
MQLQHAELLARLGSFFFDEPGCSFTFTQRLAKENGWSLGHAARVVAEYKRFAFLAIVAGHPVSPSDAIDQAWHLHLVYTRSYWERFCGEVLRRPLHHQPSRGGNAETEKFADWYERTLQSYERFFGEKPPSDIWPYGVSHTEEAFQRVDVHRFWLVPKPRWQVAVAAVSLLLALTVVGCAPQLASAVPLFDLRGPDFLVFYLVATVLSFALALWLRRSLRKPVQTPARSDTATDPYVIAALAGGPAQIVNAALVSLEQQSAIMVDSANPPNIKPAKELSTNAHPVERHIRNHLALGGDSIAVVRERFRPIADEIYGALTRQGWVVTDADSTRARLLPTIVALVLPAIGFIKILVALQRERPVGYLVALVIVSTIAALILFARRPRRSVLGDRVLKLTRERFSITSTSSELADYPATHAIVPATALAVALYGLSRLEGTPHEHLRKQLTPPANATSSGCSSSCGGDAGISTTAGCGGGDGGGGDGGGCGGCGGD